MFRINDFEPALIPATLALVILALLGVEDAGFSAVWWYPAALFLLVLLALCVWARRGLLGSRNGAALVSIGTLALLAVWTFASLAWSEVKGDAWDGANRALMYVIVYALFAALSLRARDRAFLVGAYALFLAVAGVAVFVEA